MHTYHCIDERIHSAALNFWGTDRCQTSLTLSGVLPFVYKTMARKYIFLYLLLLRRLQLWTMALLCFCFCWGLWLQSQSCHLCFILFCWCCCCFRWWQYFCFLFQFIVRIFSGCCFHIIISGMDFPNQIVLLFEYFALCIHFGGLACVYFPLKRGQSNANNKGERASEPIFQKRKNHHSFWWKIH